MVLIADVMAFLPVSVLKLGMAMDKVMLLIAKVASSSIKVNPAQRLERSFT